MLGGRYGCVRIRIRIRINLQMTSLNVWNMSLFEHFFKVLSLYLEVRIRIRIKVKGRVTNTGRTFEYRHPNKGVKELNV
jgi:hypothetical protein